jgi:hypothetical protein
MKMDGSDILKLSATTKGGVGGGGGGGGGGASLPLSASSSSALDTGGLTFGPAWLRQLSSGDSSKISALPPSPGLAFQLAKHRYGKEEMLAIYESIEKTLSVTSAPSSLVNEFEELFKKDLQKPISLAPLTLEEQVGSNQK